MSFELISLTCSLSCRLSSMLTVGLLHPSLQTAKINLYFCIVSSLVVRVDSGQLAMVHSATINMGVHGSFWCKYFKACRYTHSNGINVSENGSLFSFWRDFPSWFLYPPILIYIPTSREQRVCLSFLLSMYDFLYFWVVLTGLRWCHNCGLICMYPV